MNNPYAKEAIDMFKVINRFRKKYGKKTTLKVLLIWIKDQV